MEEFVKIPSDVLDHKDMIVEEYSKALLSRAISNCIEDDRGTLAASDLDNAAEEIRIQI